MAIISQNQLSQSITSTTSFFRAGTNIIGTVPIIVAPYFITATGSYPTTFANNSTTASGTNLDGTTNTQGGFFPYNNPTSGNNYISQVKISSFLNIPEFVIYDALWYSNSIAEATTTAQTINSITLPARDANGTSNGLNVIAWFAINAATANTAIVTPTISYTNSAGVSGRTGTTLFSIQTGGTNAGWMSPFTLQSGDYGVQSIQSITLGTSLVSGTVSLFLMRNIVNIGLVEQTALIYDWAQIGMPQLFNGSCLGIYISNNISNNANNLFCGTLTIANG